MSSSSGPRLAGVACIAGMHACRTCLLPPFRPTSTLPPLLQAAPNARLRSCLALQGLSAAAAAAAALLMLLADQCRVCWGAVMLPVDYVPVFPLEANETMYGEVGWGERGLGSGQRWRLGGRQ